MYYYVKLERKLERLKIWTTVTVTKSSHAFKFPLLQIFIFKFVGEIFKPWDSLELLRWPPDRDSRAGHSWSNPPRTILPSLSLPSRCSISPISTGSLHFKFLGVSVHVIFSSVVSPIYIFVSWEILRFSGGKALQDKDRIVRIRISLPSSWSRSGTGVTD